MVYKITRTYDNIIEFSGFGDLRVSLYNLHKFVYESQEKIQKGELLGGFENNTDDPTHRVKSLEIDEYGVVTGELEVLDTHNGKKLKELMDNGFPMFDHFRVYPNLVLSENEDGETIIDEVKSFDLLIH